MPPAFPYRISEIIGNTAHDLQPAVPRLVRVALAGGNCNNGARCGARYLNLNNLASRANWNIGASLSHPFYNYGVVATPTM